MHGHFSQLIFSPFSFLFLKSVTIRQCLIKNTVFNRCIITISLFLHNHNYLSLGKMQDKWKPTIHILSSATKFKLNFQRSIIGLAENTCSCSTLNLRTPLREVRYQFQNFCPHILLLQRVN